MTRLDVQDLAVRVGKRLLIDGLTFDVEPGRFVGLVGPNGSGKSTLLKTIYRVNAIDRGAVLLDGTAIDSLSPRAVARQLAVVGQETPNDLEFTVDEIVMLGRLPHQGVFASTSSADQSKVSAALLRTGVGHLGDRRWQTLSGGEKQRVLLARALAQDPQLLLLDEPTNHLDIRHQLALLSLTRSLGTTTVAALHDLDLAAQFCDLVIVLHAGVIVAHGAPDDVLVDEVLAPVFGVHVDRIVHPRTGESRLVFSPMTEGAPVRV